MTQASEKRERAREQRTDISNIRANNSKANNNSSSSNSRGLPSDERVFRTEEAMMGVVFACCGRMGKVLHFFSGG